MDSQKIEVPLLNGKWELDCFEMTFANKTSPPSRFEGKGFISQDENGRLRLKLLATSDPASSLDIFGNDRNVPGQLIDADQYYLLSVRDLNGNHWLAQRLLSRGSHYSMGMPSESLVTADIHELTSEGDSHYADSVHALRLVFFTSLDLPANAVRQTETRFAGERFSGESRADLAKFGTEHCQFLFYQEKGRVIVSCEAINQFPPNFDVRITEAMSFVFARKLSWNIFELHSDGHKSIRIRGERWDTPKSYLPPIAINYRSAIADSWVLFDKYLSFVCNWKESTYHPCTRHLLPVYHTNQGTIEARALALSVSVEGLTTVLFPDDDKKSKETKEFVGRLRDHCLAWKEFADPKTKTLWLERVSGLIGQLSSPSTRETLSRLATSKALDERLVRAWTKLRPKAAHGNVWGSSNVQALVDLCTSVRMLIHQLVFKAIGYEGMFTDYSTREFPLKRYRGRPATEEEIAVVASRLWKQDGEKPGDDWHYWFTAKAKLDEGIA